MMKIKIVLSPAQAASLLSAYHTLDEIVTNMERHNAEHLNVCACATAARDELYHLLVYDEDSVWDDGAVVLKEEEE